jgi:hypothetical protein
MLPIRYWPAKSPKPRAGIKRDEQKGKASRGSPFLNVFPRFRA